jgi:hypothetical protein
MIIESVITRALGNALSQGKCATSSKRIVDSESLKVRVREIKVSQAKIQATATCSDGSHILRAGEAVETTNLTLTFTHDNEIYHA